MHQKTLCCFHLFAIVNNAAMKTGTQISVLISTFILWGGDLEVESLDHVVILCLTF